MQKALIMKKLSILALAATALLISGANGIAANNNLHSVITTTKKAAGDVTNVSVSGTYNSSDWFSQCTNIALGLNNITKENGFGVLCSTSYGEGSPAIELYDADMNLTTISTVEGFGNQILLNRGAAHNYKGYFLNVPAGLHLLLGNPFTSKNDYVDEYLHFESAQYFYCDIENGSTGQWTSVEMPSEVTVDSDNITLASGETHAIIASKVGGTELLKYIYSTSDNTIASVSSDGTITANNAGTCTITVKYGVVTKQISLTVTGAEAVQTGIKIKTGKTIETTEGRGYSLSDLVAVKMYGDVEGDQIAITEDMISDGVVILDVGINRTDTGLCGDVLFDSVKDKCSYITPVPGGVGQMTVAMLSKNVLKAYKMQKNIN